MTEASCEVVNYYCQQLSGFTFTRDEFEAIVEHIRGAVHDGMIRTKSVFKPEKKRQVDSITPGKLTAIRNRAERRVELVDEFSLREAMDDRDDLLIALTQAEEALELSIEHLWAGINDLIKMREGSSLTPTQEQWCKSAKKALLARVALKV